MEWITDPGIWIALVTLTALEIVLGIDNIIFISILSSKLPIDQRDRARITGLSLALITRIMLLLSLSWVIGLTAPLVTIWGVAVSGRALILILGGLFLIAKSVHEIHEKMEGIEGEVSTRVVPSFKAVIVQILLLDVVFSLDSVITAVGMVDQIAVMVAAVIIAVGFMLMASGGISRFVEHHPTVKMLAMAFLVLIGVNLLAEGFGKHVEKGYTYFAMSFALAVEMLNLRMKHKQGDVSLPRRHVE